MREILFSKHRGNKEGAEMYNAAENNEAAEMYTVSK